MKKGFTLIELLVVIAILAVLAVAVVLVLNPAELLRQARDSTRLSDLSAVNNSIALFLADVSTSTWSTTVYCTVGTTAPSGSGTSACTANSSTAVNGSGWVPINFNAISTGSPLPNLPIDPVNSTTTTACAGTPSGCFYVYRPSSTMGKYKLYANMESAKFTTAPNNVESSSKDGGNSDTWYEIGSDMTLQ
jgi:prepilin-type N-terminal cleavage/methylation domain-containing protein